MFIWQQFTGVAPKAVESRRMKPTNEPKSPLQWLNVKKTASKSLVKVVDKKGLFNFHPYSYTPWGIHKAL